MQIKRVHDPLQTKVQNVLGSYEEVKSVIGHQDTTNSLIGVVRQPSTPVSTKVKGDDPFATLATKVDTSPSLPNVKQEKKSILNGQHRPKHGHQKGETSETKRVKSKESGNTIVANASHKQRTGVFDQFQNWEHMESKLKDSKAIQNEARVRENSYKEWKDKRGSYHKNESGKSEDKKFPSYRKGKDSRNHSRERLKSKSEAKEKIDNGIGSKTENSGQDNAKGLMSSENKPNGSSADANPNSQKLTACLSYGSSKPSSVFSQPHTSPGRECRDPDASFMSTLSTVEPMFQPRTNNTGKTNPTVSPPKSHIKLPNGLSKDVKKDRSAYVESKNKVLKLKVPNQVGIIQHLQ